MDDGIDSGKIDRVRVAHVALDDGEVRMWLEKISEPHNVERHHLVAGLEQFGNEDATLIATRTGHENLHRLVAPRNLPRARPDAISCLQHGETKPCDHGPSGHDRPVAPRSWRGFCLNSEWARRKLSGL